MNVIYVEQVLIIKMEKELKKLCNVFYNCEAQRDRNSAFIDLENFLSQKLTIQALNKINDIQILKLITLYLMITKKLNNKEKDLFIDNCKNKLDANIMSLGRIKL